VHGRSSRRPCADTRARSRAAASASPALTRNTDTKHHKVTKPLKLTTGPVGPVPGTGSQDRSEAALAGHEAQRAETAQLLSGSCEERERRSDLASARFGSLRLGSCKVAGVGPALGHGRGHDDIGPEPRIEWAPRGRRSPKTGKRAESVALGSAGPRAVARPGAHRLTQSCGPGGSVKCG